MSVKLVRPNRLMLVSTPLIAVPDEEASLTRLVFTCFHIRVQTVLTSGAAEFCTKKWHNRWTPCLLAAQKKRPAEVIRPAVVNWPSD
ncbi:hypothetical protein Pla100_06570 [Neorhodopirellula pilleata]|uniref:Uncharacterized protein n=1 Tax=Neorhodopirellula pilleata TaxID=2714738 RepID=A0A5C6AW45_9BACT|nr:hypothetical protein Pla100_06570 [Neorhodopirellula pilleata]